MAQRRLSRAFRAIFGSRRESTPAQTPPPPDTPSDPSLHDTDGSSYDQELHIVHNPPPAPSTPPPPPPPNPSPPPPTNNPPTPPPQSTKPPDEDTPSSHYSLRPRPARPTPASDPAAVDTSRPRPEPSPSPPVSQLNPAPPSARNSQPPLAAPAPATSAQPRFAGPHRPAPSAGTNSAIAARPDLLDVATLHNADLHILRLYSRRAGLSTVGSRDVVLARLVAKLHEKKPLNEDTMIVDADGVPRTPSRGGEKGGAVAEGGGRGGLTTTTVDPVGMEVAGVQCGEGVVAKSTEGKAMASCSGDVQAKGGNVGMRLQIPVKAVGGAPFVSTNGFPTMSMTGVGVSGDMPHSPAFFAPPVRWGIGDGGGGASGVLRAVPATVKDVNRPANPGQSVDARGGGRHGMDMNKIFRELAGGGRALSPSEYEACVKALTDNVVANADNGAAALLVSKTGPGSAGVKAVSGRQGDKGGDGRMGVVKGQSVAKGPSRMRPPQVPPGPYGTVERVASGGGANDAPGNRAGDRPAGDQGNVTLNERRDSDRAGQPGPVERNAASEGGGKLETGEHGKSSDVKGVQPELRKDNPSAEDDTASERKLTNSGQRAKLRDGGQDRMGLISGPGNSRAERNSGQQKGFVFNLNTVADDNKPRDATASNPFKGVFSGAAGGPDAHNTLGLTNNVAASRAAPPAQRSTPADQRRGSQGEFQIPASVDRTPPLESDHRQGTPSRDEQGFATPQEILRSFNRYGPNHVPGEDEEQEGGAERDTRGNDGPETDKERFLTPTSLPRNLRGFSSMSKPSRRSHRSSLRVTGSASGQGIGTLSSFRPRRPVSTVSAGIFVNLRNSDLAPENKHIAEKLRTSRSLKGGSPPSERLPGSSMRILHELKRVRAENRSGLSTKRSISPMPVPPSVAKRARLVGEFDKSALTQNKTANGADRMQDVEVAPAVPAASTSSQPLQTSSSVYPTTPLRPPTRLKALPSSMKKRKYTVFGSGRKRPKSSRLAEAAISEMESQNEQKNESREESFNVTNKNSLNSGKAPTVGSRLPGLDDMRQSPKKAPKSFALDFSRESAEQSKIREAGTELATATSRGVLGPISGKRKASSITPDANTFPSSSFDQVQSPAEHRTAVDDSPVSKKKRRSIQSLDEAKAAEGTAENPLKRVSFDNLSGTAARPPQFSFGGEISSPTAFGVLKKTDIENNPSETPHKASAGDPKMFSSIGKAFAERSDKAGTPSSNAGTEGEGKEEAAAKAGPSPVARNNDTKQSEELSDKPLKNTFLQTDPKKSSPIISFGQPSTGAMQGLSAYDLFKNQTSKTPSADMQKSTPGVLGLSSGPAPSHAAFSAIPPGSSQDFKQIATPRNGSDSREQNSASGAAMPTNKTELDNGKPLVFGTDPQGSKSSSGFSLPFTTAALGTSSPAGFSFGAQIGTTEPQSGAKTVQGAAIDFKGSEFKVPTETKVTTTKGEAAGSMFVTPKDKLFSNVESHSGSNVKPAADKSAAVPEQQQPAPSIFSGTNAATVTINPAPQSLAPQSTPSKAAELTGTAGIFGASSSSLGGATVGFSFGSATSGGELKEQVASEATAPNISNPFGIKKLSGSEGLKVGGDAFKPSPTLTPAAPLFGQVGSQSAASSQGTAEVKQPLVFGQTVSMSSIGNVGNIQGGTQPFPRTGNSLFSGGHTGGIEKTAGGPFQGPQFKPTFAAKPAASTFVFGANTSQKQSDSIAKPLGGTGGGNGNQPDAFAPVPSTPAASFGNPQPTFGATPSFGATPASPAPLGQQFGSLPQPAPTPASIFGQPQSNSVGTNSFGTTPPAFGAPPGQTPPLPFGAAPMAIPNPSFGGFGSAGNQQAANPGGSTMMGAPQGNQSQFGTGFGKPVFGAPNPQGDSSGGFNMGAQQAPSVRRGRKFLRARRMNR